MSRLHEDAKTSLPYYLLVIGIFLIIVSPKLLSEGMFLDGLIYATLAHNLSEGIGSFWNPMFTETMGTFHEHPPLAFGIQSLFYTFFGDYLIIDKLYSAFTYIVVGYVLVRIWRMYGLRHGWFPLLLWFSVPVIQWCSGNNMLENTISIFSSLSVLCYLKAQQNNRYLHMLIAGVLIALAFLTKGFIACFPWAMPFVMWAVLQKNSAQRMIVDSLLMVGATLLTLGGLAFTFPEAGPSILKYFDTQVVSSLKSVVTVETRAFIVIRLFSELLPAFAICGLMLLWGRAKKLPMPVMVGDKKTASAFIFLGLAGVLPIMISMKQSGFYILATYPLFAIALGMLLYPLIDNLFRTSEDSKKIHAIARWLGPVTFIVGLGLCIYFSGGIGRDQERIEDLRVILSEVPEGSVISIDPDMWDDWALHAYFYRYGKVSLDKSPSVERDYLLLSDYLANDSVRAGYQPVALDLHGFKVYEKDLE